MKTTKLILILLLVLFIFFSILQWSKLAIENSKLRNAVKERDIIADSYYYQLQELAFIFENACNDKDKFALYDAISKYRELKQQELDKKGITYIEVPETNVKLAKTLYGENGNLKFHFNESGKLKKIEFLEYAKRY